MNMPQQIPALLKAMHEQPWGEKVGGAAPHHPMTQEAIGLVVTDHDGVVVYVDSLAEQIFHREAGMFVGKPFGYRVAEDEATVIEIFSPDGTPYHAELSVVDRDWEGKPAYVIALKRIDDWRNQKIKESLQKSNNRFLALINASPLAIVTLNNDGTVIFWSKSAEKLFGWSIHEVLGKAPPILSGDGNDDFARWCDRVLDGDAELEMELLGQRTRDGNLIDLRIWASNLEDETGSMGGVMMVIADVTEHNRVETQIQFLTTHDGLTGLPNRILLCDRISQALLKICREGHKMVAVLHIGLNNFSLIWESLGFGVGDQLLKGVAQRLAGVIRQSDTLARHGEDTFAVMLPSLEREQDAVKIAGKILDSFILPFLCEEQEIFLSANVGIAVSSSDGESAEALVMNADAAMRRAHMNTKSDFHFYTPDMNEMATRRLTLIRGLRRALERQELCLYYQPVVELTTDRVVGVEALLRWRHPELGLISPGEFIPLAEEDGVIVPIGEWVLREGCTQIKRWEQQGLGGLRLAVNLSARQFSQVDLPLRVASILGETGVTAELVEIELTESMLASDVEDAVTMMNQLKSIGVRLSIDDFGTGYSSLSYLKRFPLDVLKIDRSFVCEIPFNADDIQICSAIVAMAHGFNFRVIAEGAETQAQVNFLRGQHCDEIQGFFYSKPLPPEELADFLIDREEQWQPGGRIRKMGASDCVNNPVSY